MTYSPAAVIKGNRSGTGIQARLIALSPERMTPARVAVLR
jgi:hypothetical protein